MKTRTDYLAHRCTHAEYYAQFVTPQIKHRVEQEIGMKNLKRSTDKHLNDIPLARWDAMEPLINSEAHDKLVECGDFPSLSSSVCIAKQAARQLLGK